MGAGNFDEFLEMPLTQYKCDHLRDENLWLFSKSDDSQQRYSVGFFMDEHNALRPVNEPAFCFFPTKVDTGLNFIIHAPFLLTDSREGIRAGIQHNEKMVKLLADLAAHAIVLLRKIGERESTCLIVDGIMEIIPYNKDDFTDLNSRSKISFYPFYESIKKVFETEEILPAKIGYASSKNAYWAAVPRLTQLFSDEQLSLICENDNAKWVFTSKGRDETQNNNKPLCNYIDSIVRTNLNERAIISGRSKDSFYNRIFSASQSLERVKGITATFIEAQSIPWLIGFYKWLFWYRCGIIKSSNPYATR